MPYAAEVKSTRWLVVVVACVVLGGAVAVWLLDHGGPSDAITASGTIEVTQSEVAPKVQGRLVSLRVSDGSPVRRGEVLATLESVDPTLSLEQARANVAAAEQQVVVAGTRAGQSGENLGIENASTSLSVDQATAQLISAESALRLAATNLSRAQSLVSTGDEPRQMFDDASNAYLLAQSNVKTARDAIALAQANRANVTVRELDVRAARLQQLQAVSALDQARAALGLAEDQVHETTLVAPYDGYVISHNFEAGDLVQPGADVITVGDLDHPYVYVYVSETDLPRVHTGATADVFIDGMPGRAFTGTVTEIATTAEFTPENVQTQEQRIEYLVFRVKIQLVDKSGTLKPGLPVDAHIHV